MPTPTDIVNFVHPWLTWILIHFIYYKALALTVKDTTHSEKIILSRHDSKTINMLIPALTLG